MTEATVPTGASENVTAEQPIEQIGFSLDRRPPPQSGFTSTALAPDVAGDRFAEAPQSSASVIRHPSSVIRHPPVAHAAALAALCFVCFFWRLGAVGLFDFNEGLYTQVAREMYLRGDYVTPRANGLYFFDKPPLSIWQSALSFKLFGVSEFAARLPVALAATLLVVLTYAFGARWLGRRVGLFAALALALNPLFFGTARQNTMDIHLSLWFGVAMFCFLSAFVATTPRGKWWYVPFWLACGIGWLAKSVPGLLPIVLAFAFVLVRERFAWRRVAARLWESKPWLGIPMLVGVIAPWVLLAYRANGSVFYEEFWLLHHVKLANGSDFNHAQPFWYYVPALLAGMFPWALFLPAATAGAVRMWRGPNSAAPQSDSSDPTNQSDRAAQQNDAALFLLVWAVGLTIIFSLMVSKLVSYLLPMYPAAALLIGWYLSRATDTRAAAGSSRALVWGATACAAVAVAGFCGGVAQAHHILASVGAAAESARRAVPPAVIVFGVHALILAAVGMSTGAALVWLGRRSAGVWAVVAAAVAFVALADTEGLAAMQPTMNAPLEALSRELGRLAESGAQVAVYIGGPTRPSVLFYLPDSLYVGKPLPGRPGPFGGLVNYTGDRPVIDEFLATRRPSYILTDDRRAAELLASTESLRSVDRRGAWVLLRAESLSNARPASARPPTTAP